MALKEHPFVVTTSIKHDKSTIKYDKTKKNRSDAVGKVYKINAAGKAELPADGEEFEGVIISVDETQITAAYMFGGLKVPLATSGGSTVTVVRGDKLVAGLGPSNAKGFVKSGSVADLADVSAVPTQAEHNAVRAAINNLKKGKGSVMEFDKTHALLAFPG